tara:strand:- start:57393 stop:57590 length:198 start_codon:yes stop_codon:yes gene_type:complete
MTLRDLINLVTDSFFYVVLEIKFFFYDLYDKIVNGEILELTLWQVSFILIFLWIVFKKIKKICSH